MCGYMGDGPGTFQCMGLDTIDHLRTSIMQHNNAQIHPVSMHRLLMALQRSQEGSVRLLCIDDNV
jgi:hypothetical protein